MSNPGWPNLARRATAVATDPICSMYRFVIPLRDMIGRSWCAATIYALGEPSFSFAPDQPLLVQRHIAFDESIMTLVREHRPRLVHDIDDLLWAIPRDNPNAEVVTPAMLTNMQRSLRSAAVVTTSTEPLADELRLLGLTPVVLPNLLDPADWPAPVPPRGRTRLRIGWYGQQNVHIGDLAIIEEVVRALEREVDFVFFGDLPHGLTAEQGRLETYASTSIELFPSMLAALDLDILLSPLAKNRFNTCKSNLRLLQAGILGIAAIATDIEPHRTLPVALVANDPPAWINAIRERVGEIAAVRTEGERLREAVLAEYTVSESRARYTFQTWFGHAPAA